MYNSIKEYYRLRGLLVKDLTKEHVAYYLHLRTAKRDVEDLEELLKLIDQWGVKYALRRMSRLCQRARAISGKGAMCGILSSCISGEGITSGLAMCLRP